MFLHRLSAGKTKVLTDFKADLFDCRTHHPVATFNRDCEFFLEFQTESNNSIWLGLSVKEQWTLLKALIKSLENCSERID